LKVGVTVPNDGELVEGLGLVRMAQAAEVAGAASIWVSDHVLMVDDESRDYPYSVDGEPSWPRDADYFEALCCLAHLAAATERVRLGTAVLVLPQRNVLEVAKMAATIDRLSGGRLVLGVGAGWSQSEFEALGYTYADRGERFDEMLDALHECWSGRPPAFEGAKVTYPANVILNPPPVSDRVPLLVGGRTKPALRRAARHGDGWCGIAFAPEWDTDVLGGQLETVRRLRQECGGGKPLYNILKLHASDGDWERLPQLVVETRELGFDEVTVDLPWEHGVDSAVETFAAVLRAV
jgi:probable F420-dependent oxidoreductase